MYPRAVIPGKKHERIGADTVAILRGKAEHVLPEQLFAPVWPHLADGAGVGGNAGDGEYGAERLHGPL